MFVKRCKAERVFALRSWPILACLALAACGPYPRDVSGTLDRIEREERFTVGFGALTPRDEQVARRFVARLERASGAEATLERGPLERQLIRLDEGELDLVIGELAEDTPWAARVAVIEPLGRRHEGKRRLGLTPVAANGENRWIALLEREVRDSAGPEPARGGQ